MFIGILYHRIGGDIIAIADTKKQAETAILEKYDKAFMDLNGYSAKEEICYNSGSVSYYDNAKADIEYYEIERNTAEWF